MKIKIATITTLLVLGRGHAVFSMQNDVGEKLKEVTNSLSTLTNKIQPSTSSKAASYLILPSSYEQEVQNRLLEIKEYLRKKDPIAIKKAYELVQYNNSIGENFFRWYVDLIKLASRNEEKNLDEILFALRSISSKDLLTYWTQTYNIHNYCSTIAIKLDAKKQKEVLIDPLQDTSIANDILKKLDKFLGQENVAFKFMPVLIDRLKPGRPSAAPLLEITQYAVFIYFLIHFQDASYYHLLTLFGDQGHRDKTATIKKTLDKHAEELAEIIEKVDDLKTAIETSSSSTSAKKKVWKGEENIFEGLFTSENLDTLVSEIKEARSDLAGGFLLLQMKLNELFKFNKKDLNAFDLLKLANGAFLIADQARQAAQRMTTGLIESSAEESKEFYAWRAMAERSAELAYVAASKVKNKPENSEQESQAKEILSKVDKLSDSLEEIERQFTIVLGGVPQKK